MQPADEVLKIQRVLEESWKAVVRANPILLPHDEEGQALLQRDLVLLARAIENESRVMVERRRQVEDEDPWRFGLILAFLEGKATARDEVDDPGSPGHGVSRFLVFQRSGFWTDRGFNRWADELTGVARGTWQNWKRAARVYLLSRVGQTYIERGGLTPRTFVQTVPMDKALRACSRASTGGLAEHQVKALCDTTVTSEGMRHALRVTAPEWEEEKEEQKEKDLQWVESGNPGRKVVEFDHSTRALRLSFMEDNEWVTYTVARLPVPAHPLVGEAHEIIVKAVRDGFE